MSRLEHSDIIWSVPDVYTSFEVNKSSTYAALFQGQISDTNRLVDLFIDMTTIFENRRTKNT